MWHNSWSYPQTLIPSVSPCPTSEECQVVYANAEETELVSQPTVPSYNQNTNPDPSDVTARDLNLSHPNVRNVHPGTHESQKEDDSGL